MTTSIIFNTLNDLDVRSALIMIDGTSLAYNSRYQELKYEYLSDKISAEECAGRVQALFLEHFPGHVKFANFLS